MLFLPSCPFASVLLLPLLPLSCLYSYPEFSYPIILIFIVWLLVVTLNFTANKSPAFPIKQHMSVGEHSARLLMISGIFLFLKVCNGQFKGVEKLCLCDYGVAYFWKALVIENFAFCNISVWGVINYSMPVLSMGKYLKCDSLCKYLSSTKLLYFFLQVMMTRYW